MYYIINTAGQTEGPYPADWIRSHAQPQTQVSYEQRWVPYASHPEFQQRTSEPAYYIIDNAGQTVGPYPADWIRSNAQPDTQVSCGPRWTRYASHPYFHPTPAHTTPVVRKQRPRIEIASQPSEWLIKRAVLYLVVGIVSATLLCLANQAAIRDSGMQTDSGTWMSTAGTLQMTITWLLGFAIVLFPAFVLGRLFGGRARFSEIIYAFARTAAILYILLPLTLLLYWRWFLHLRDTHVVLALLVVLFQFLLLPIVCIVFGIIGIRSFVKSMAFAARWRAWATVLSSLLLSTLLILAASDWFAIWHAFMKWFS
jgi:hypothetical protein